MRGDAFAFYLAGGVFRVVPWLAEEMPRRLVEVAPRSQVQMLHEEPAVGAVWLALEEARGGARLPHYKGAGLKGQLSAKSYHLSADNREPTAER
jgi:hypothetical protein